MNSGDKKVLIMGIDSFTGRYLERELSSAGYAVSGTVFSEPARENYFRADISRIEEIKIVLRETRPDYIVNLAAQSFVAHDDMRDFYDINLFGVENLLKAILDVRDAPGPAKIILASSANVYGNSGVMVINENVSPAPVNHYALSKYAMEQISRNYFDRLNIMITRPFNYTGVGQTDRFVVPKIVNHFKSGETVIELGNIDMERDFSDVRDVARGYRLIMESDERSGVINICSSRAVSIRKILELCGEITGRTLSIDVKKEFIRERDIMTLRGDNARLLRLGYTVKYTIEDTLRWMLSE